MLVMYTHTYNAQLYSVLHLELNNFHYLGCFMMGNFLINFLVQLTRSLNIIQKKESEMIRVINYEANIKFHIFNLIKKSFN